MDYWGAKGYVAPPPPSQIIGGGPGPPWPPLFLRLCEYVLGHSCKNLGPLILTIFVCTIFPVSETGQAIMIDEEKTECMKNSTKVRSANDLNEIFLLR